MNRRLLAGTILLLLLVAGLAPSPRRARTRRAVAARTAAGRPRRRRPAGHRQHEPARRRDRRRLRGLEHPVRHAHRQGGQGLRDDPRPRRVVGGVEGRAHVDLQDAPGPEVVRRQAAHRRGRRLDDQHLARRGVAQPHRDRGEPRRRGDRRHHARDHGRRCPTRSSRPWTSTSCPSTSGASWTPTGGRSTTATTGSAPGRSCSRSSRRASSRASRRTRTSGAASPPSTRSCCASSTTPTRWWPRSRPASSTPRTDLPAAALPAAREGPRAS